jgi:hypothetical protein
MTDKEPCPVCRHDMHTTSGCNETCACKFEKPEVLDKRGNVKLNRRKATQAWQLLVPGHDTPEYEKLNATFYESNAAGSGLKGAIENYAISLQTGKPVRTWGEALLMKMQLRWGLQLALFNPRSFVKMVNNLIRIVAWNAIQIYEQEIDKNIPPFPSAYTVAQEMSLDVNEPTVQTEFRRLKVEYETARAPWDRARARIDNEIISFGEKPSRYDQTGDIDD